MSTERGTGREARAWREAQLRTRVYALCVEGLPQNVIAERLGISRGHVSRLLNEAGLRASGVRP